MQDNHVFSELKENVCWVWLNRPDAGNAYSEQMVQKLPALLKDADLCPDVKVIVLAAKGEIFCAGGDLKLMLSKRGMFAGDPNELRDNYMRGIQQIPITITQLKKPLITCVQGPAIGAGCDLASMGDLRVASDHAFFATTFVKVGLIPGDGGAWFIIRAVGFSKAQEMFYTGKKYSALEAQQMGLIHNVYLFNQLFEETQKLAQMLAKTPHGAIQLMKKTLNHAYETQFFHHLDVCAAFQGILQNSSDHLVAVREFLNKTNR